ncbi:MAG TPA: TlpA disulfide reductase family protein [bacterium]
MRLSVTLALLLTLPLLTLAADKPSSLVGKAFPNLSGQGTSGKLVNLQQMKREVEFLKDAQGQLIKEPSGRYKTKITDYVIVLNFFATYCVPCVKEIPTFNKIATAYPNQPVRFVYVNVDNEKSPAEVREFAKSKGIDVEMMFPSVSHAIQTYGIESLPRIVVIDAKGTVSTVITGFQENLAAQIDGIVKPLLVAQR